MSFGSVVYRQGKRLTDTIGCISEVGEDCFPSLIFFLPQSLIHAKAKQIQAATVSDRRFFFACNRIDLPI